MLKSPKSSYNEHKSKNAVMPIEGSIKNYSNIASLAQNASLLLELYM